MKAFGDQMESRRQQDELYRQQEEKLNYQRKKIIEEIITQEQTYIRDLELIVRFLIPKVEENISKEDAQKMFINLPELVKINQQFLNKLLVQVEKKNQKHEDQLKIEKEEYYGKQDSKLFKVFKNDDIVQMFQQYKEYNQKYQEAEEHRTKYEKDQKYLDAIQEAGQQIYMAKYQQYVQSLEENTNQYQTIITEYHEDIEFRNTFSRLQKNCNKFKAIIQTANNVKGIDDIQALESYMIKPTQRLPRYELQFGELEKLSRNHPDYENIKQLLKQFKEINQGIDVAVEKQKQWKDIQKKFNDEQRKKIKPSSECILFEKHVQYRLAKSEEWQDCSLICLSDKIIIYRDSKKSIFGEFTFTTEILFIQEQWDDTYKEFQIVNSRKMSYFQVQSENYDRITKQIEKQIIEFKEQLKTLLEQGGGWDTSQIEVTVQGTEEYDIATTNNYTVFIIKLSLQDGEVDWKIYKRFSELENIQNYILKLGWRPDKAVLKQGSWFSLHDNEHLKDIFTDIQNFIISIFGWSKFKEENEIQKTVLRCLGIPNNFISLPQIFGKNIFLESKRQSMIKQSEKEKILQQSNSLNQRFLEELKKTKMIGESIRKKNNNYNLDQIQNDPEKYTSEDINENEKEKEKEIEVQIPYSIYKLYEKNQFIHPKVKSVLDSLSIKIKVDYLTKIIEMCEIIANFIRLKEFHDFRLVLIDSRGNKRMLDNDQIVLQSLPKNFVQKTSLSKLQIEQITYYLHFQKYIFFPPKIETLLFQGDKIRLIMINDHFFRELKFYQFTLDQYVLVYALFVIIFQKHDPKNKNYFVLDTKDLDKLITQKIRKTQPDEFWQEQPQVGNLYHRLCEVVKNQYYNSVSVDEEISYLARLALAKFSYQQNVFELFGTISFYVGINMELENNNLLQDKLNLLPNVYLGITYNAIKLFNPSNKKQLKQFELAKVYEAIAEPAYLILEIIRSDPQKQQNVNQVKEKIRQSEGQQKINRKTSEIERQEQRFDDKTQLEMHLLEKTQIVEQIEKQKNGQEQIEKEKYKFKTAEAYRISQLIREYKSHQEV